MRVVKSVCTWGLKLIVCRPDQRDLGDKFFQIQSQNLIFGAKALAVKSESEK